MSPGATFERVYLALKQTILSGTFPPGTQLEPAALAERFVASITPVRDALHRLVGERLVHTPRNDGFRIPIYTEASLRDLYGWNLRLLQLATHGPAVTTSADPTPLSQSEAAFDPARETAFIFSLVARLAASAELAAAVSMNNDRLHVVREREASVLPAESELEELSAALDALDLPLLRRLIAVYHRRRIASVPRLLEQLQPIE